MNHRSSPPPFPCSVCSISALRTHNVLPRTSPRGKGGAICPSCEEYGEFLSAGLAFVAALALENPIPRRSLSAKQEQKIDDAGPALPLFPGLLYISSCLDQLP